VGAETPLRTDALCRNSEPAGHHAPAHGNHPEGNSYIERLHRSLKEEEEWLNEYQNFDQAKLSIARWIEVNNHDRPHRGAESPHQSRAQFLAQSLTSNMAPCV
jgi:hypothetical protein